MTSREIDTILVYLQRVVPRGHAEEVEISTIISKLKAELKKKPKK